MVQNLPTSTFSQLVALATVLTHQPKTKIKKKELKKKNQSVRVENMVETSKGGALKPREAARDGVRAARTISPFLEGCR